MTLPGGQPYFDERMRNRQRLLWAIATRRELDRWEVLVGRELRDSLSGRETKPADVWAAGTEHHFLLIAARNLLRALELPPASTVALDATVRAELRESRDLHEHWQDNMPIFNIQPRTLEPPHASGRDFAERNPDRGPYTWWEWSSERGPHVTPNVTAAQLHDLVDAVEQEVLGDDPTFAVFVPLRNPSPWIGDEVHRWWPKPDA